MFSRFFIDRPVFASVLSLVIVIAGLMAMRALPIAQYPNIVPPEVQVTATYPGASAEVIASTVAAPLEQQINGVNRMIYISSTSSNNGTLTIEVTFEIGTDPDQAAIDVNNRVQAALPRLPEEVRRQGVIVNKRSSAFLQVITMYSKDGSRSPLFVSNYALLNVLDELKRIPGVGEAILFGARDYSMRVWLRPDKLAQYRMTPADVANVIREQNSQFAAGAFGSEPMDNPQAFTYTVTTQGRLVTEEEFGNIILRSDANGATLRLRDVARIELGAQDYSLSAKFDDKPAVGIGLFLQSGANALDTTAAVGKRMEELSQRFPPGVDYSLPFDTTRFVRISIEEVVKTFVEAILLVVLVVFLFLQNARATLIPVLAVPVSLIGTFAGMYLLGFSINLLTLFGMVLAIGIVVDDAIVVLENVERLMTQEGLSPREASIKAMEQVTGPVIAIVLVLCAVFVPVGFLGGMTGEMYKQFAITIAVSVAISGFVALTLTPAMCAALLKPTHAEPGRFFRWFNRSFERVTNGYLTGVHFLLKRALLGLVLFAGFIAITVSLYNSRPTSLVPDEDQGYVIYAAFLPPGAALSRTKAVMDEMTARILQQQPAAHAVSFAGLDGLSFSNKTNSGIAFVTLKPWDERTAPEADARNFYKSLMGLGADIKDAFILSFNPPPITGSSTTGGFEMFLQNRAGADSKTIAADVGKFLEAAGKRPELAELRTTLDVGVPQYFVDLDREKAKALGVPIQDLFATMQSTFGNYYINDFTLYGRIFRVSLQAEAEFREKPEDLRHVFVRSDKGEMIPLDTLVRIERVIGPDLVDRFNVFPAAKVSGAAAAGYSSGQALKAVEEVAAQALSTDYSVGWVGPAYQEKRVGGAAAIAFIFGIIMVFLILAAQYGRWLLPLSVLMAVPFAVFGAVLAITLRGINNDVYFQVGLLTLIGLGAKNAILIVEFAVLQRKEGQSLMQAASEAAHLRFRPIVMTSLAFILGCLPLAISSGAGSASRHSIGTGVIGGMLAATAIATFFIPLFYALIAGLAERWEQRRQRRAHHA